MSFFKNASAFATYVLHYFRDAYVFSELNEKSLSLGADIRRNHKRALIVYTDVFESNDEVSYELIERAREQVGDAVGTLWNGTFHHICNRFLRHFAKRYRSHQEAARL